MNSKVSYVKTEEELGIAIKNNCAEIHLIGELAEEYKSLKNTNKSKETMEYTSGIGVLNTAGISSGPASLSLLSLLLGADKIISVLLSYITGWYAMLTDKYEEIEIDGSKVVLRKKRKNE